MQQLLEQEQLRRQVESQQAALQQTLQLAEQQRQQLEETTRQALILQHAEEIRINDQQRQQALQEAARKLQEIQQAVQAGSPIENTFYDAWCVMYPDIKLERQYRVGKYKLDFAHVETHTAIELDGHQYHHTRKDRTKDYQRQRAIEADGWHFVRFTGSEIHNDVTSCVMTAYERIKAR